MSNLPIWSIEMRCSNLDTLRQSESPGEFPVFSLLDSIPALFLVDGALGLAGNDEAAVVYVDVYILFLEAGKLKGSSDGVGCFVLVQVHSRYELDDKGTSKDSRLTEGAQRRAHCCLTAAGPERPRCLPGDERDFRRSGRSCRRARSSRRTCSLVCEVAVSKKILLYSLVT